MQTIKDLRQARGWTQLEVAYKLGVTPLTVSKWERGVSEPRVTQLRNMAELFEVPMDEIDLVTRDEEDLSKIAA